jgi:uncharacterized protein (DUF1697 family)
MPTFIALIRGINVGGHAKLAMSDLKAVCESLGFTNVRTLLNSGNVVFEASKADAQKLEKALNGPKVILRTPKEIDDVIARNPWKRDGSLMLVMFLEDKPAKKIDWPGPEEIHLDGRHLYLYYPDRAGRSKLTNTWLEKQLGVSGTARNWNTILKLAALSHPKG